MILGISSLFTLPPNLKQYYLLFDKIALVENDNVYEELRDFKLIRDKVGTAFFGQIDWLITKGKLDLIGPIREDMLKGDPQIDDLNKFQNLLVKIIELLPDHRDKIVEAIEDWDEYEKIQKTRNTSVNQADVIFKVLGIIQSYEQRMHAISLWKEGKVDAYPVSDYSFFAHSLPSMKKSDVIKLLISNLPVPSETVDWDEIFDFRENPEIHSCFVGLKNWVNDIYNGTKSLSEIQDFLEYQIEEYSKALKLNHRKLKTARLEMIFKLPFSLIENLLKLKLSSLLDPVFEFKKIQIELLREEQKLASKDLSFVIKAHQAFQTGKMDYLDIRLP